MYKRTDLYRLDLISCIDDTILISDNAMWPCKSRIGVDSRQAPSNISTNTSPSRYHIRKSRQPRRRTQCNSTKTRQTQDNDGSFGTHDESES